MDTNGEEEELQKELIDDPVYYHFDCLKSVDNYCQARNLTIRKNTNQTPLIPVKRKKTPIKTDPFQTGYTML
jgi:hypothetical protein